MVTPTRPRRWFACLGYGRSVTSATEELNLKQVAALLDVHYMTAYRYVRTGRLPARQEAGGWIIGRHDLDRFIAGDPTDAPSPRSSDRADWSERMASALVEGDEIVAWQVIERALTAGRAPVDCYLDIIVPAIDEISGRTWSSTEPPAAEYLAVATATRVVARLGARFRKPGRSRGTIVFGAPTGELHTLPILIVADLVRLEGFTCLELGADVPASAFAGAAAGARNLIAVGIGVASVANLDAVRETIAAVHETDPSIPIVLGGQAVRSPEVADLNGATAWAADGRQAISVINAIAGERLASVRRARSTSRA